MKNFLITCLLLLPFLIIYSGCSDELISPQIESKGSLAFAIDKAAAPAEVNYLRLKLIRNGFENIVETLDIYQDSSATFFLEDIQAGVWHLLIEGLATDSTEVLYSGETDVEVISDETVLINITLLPVGGDNTGAIYIKVNWGNRFWRDFPGNAIFTANMSPSNPIGVIQAKIVYENNLYKMWYTNLYNSAVTDIGYAESVNGIIWKNVLSPVLNRGASNQWDSHSVQIGAVIKIDGQYRMYYTGMTSEYGNWHIGLATSSDGINWTKHPSPILLANSSEYQIHVDDVIKCGDQYHMYYTIRNSTGYYIGLALSADGTNWTKAGNNPILSYSSNWENGGVYFPSVIQDGNKLLMAYMNASATAFGFARSEDGIHWEKDGQNPFITNQQTYNNWTGEFAYPFLRKFNDKYYLYYTGIQNGKNAIGLITK